MTAANEFNNQEIQRILNLFEKKYFIRNRLSYNAITYCQTGSYHVKEDYVFCHRSNTFRR